MDGVGKTMMRNLSKKTNEAAGSAVSTFAMRQLEKFGWKTGLGLGKNKQGRTKHVQVRKKDDNTGVGADAAKTYQLASYWWWSSHSAASVRADSTLLMPRQSIAPSSSSSVSAKSKTGMSTSKKARNGNSSKQSEFAARDGRTTSSDDDSSDDSDDSEVLGGTVGWAGQAPPSDEELFRMCGGKRLGMRARGSQQGKWLRVEGDVLEGRLTKSMKTKDSISASVQATKAKVSTNAAGLARDYVSNYDSRIGSVLTLSSETAREIGGTNQPDVEEEGQHEAAGGDGTETSQRLGKKRSRNSSKDETKKTKKRKKSSKSKK